MQEEAPEYHVDDKEEAPEYHVDDKEEAQIVQIPFRWGLSVCPASTVTYLRVVTWRRVEQA